MKEAAGTLSGDRRVKNDGKADEANATVKDMGDTVADTLTVVRPHRLVVPRVTGPAVPPCTSPTSASSEWPLLRARLGSALLAAPARGDGGGAGTWRECAA